MRLLSVCWLVCGLSSVGFSGVSHVRAMHVCVCETQIRITVWQTNFSVYLYFVTVRSFGPPICFSFGGLSKLLIGFVVC